MASTVSLQELQNAYNKMSLSRFVSESFKKHELTKLKKEIAREKARMNKQAA